MQSDVAKLFIIDRNVDYTCVHNGGIRIDIFTIFERENKRH